MVKCTFGPDAKDGDFVVVAHPFGYQGRSTTHYLGMVYKGKVYTGEKQPDSMKTGYVHKLSALCIIDSAFVGAQRLKEMQADIAASNPEFAPPEMNLELYLKFVHFESVGDVWNAFQYCTNDEDLQKVFSMANYGYGGKFGQFSKFVASPVGAYDCDFSILRAFKENNVSQGDFKNYKWFRE